MAKSRTNKLLSSKLKTIGIFRALQLGDMLCAVPAIRAIRQSAPAAQIVLIGLPWAEEFARRFSQYIDEFIAFPGFPGLPESSTTPEQFAAFVTEVRQKHLDLLIQMHGNGSITNTIVSKLGAGAVCGFYPSDMPCPDDENHFLPYPHDVHEIRRHLKLARFLGAEATNDDLEFGLLQDDISEADRIIQRFGIGEFICFHPGARVQSRRWLPENFAAAADCLAAYGFHIVLTGAEAELEWNRKVAGAMESWPIDLTGQTTLGGLAALLRRSRLLVCNDTGVSHLAAALHVPSVVIFSNSEAQRWAPLNQKLHRACVSTDSSPVSLAAVLSEARSHLRSRTYAA